MWIAIAIIAGIYLILWFLEGIRNVVLISPVNIYSQQRSHVAALELDNKQIKNELNDAHMNASRLQQELDRATKNPEGPKIGLDLAPVSAIVVKNLGGGVAHDVVVHSFKNGTMVCDEHKIGYLADGEPHTFTPFIRSMSGHEMSSPFRFDNFMIAAERSKAPEEKTGEARVPISVTYWDGGEKDFICEYELYRNLVTQEMRFTMKSRQIQLRRV